MKKLYREKGTKLGRTLNEAIRQNLDARQMEDVDSNLQIDREENGDIKLGMNFCFKLDRKPNTGSPSNDILTFKNCAS